MIREDKEAHTHTVLSSFKGNPKKFYSYMNNIRTVKDDVTQLEKKMDHSQQMIEKRQKYYVIISLKYSQKKLTKRRSRVLSTTWMIITQPISVLIKKQSY